MYLFTYFISITIVTEEVSLMLMDIQKKKSQNHECKIQHFTCIYIYLFTVDSTKSMNFERRYYSSTVLIHTGYTFPLLKSFPVSKTCYKLFTTCIRKIQYNLSNTSLKEPIIINCECVKS